MITPALRLLLVPLTVLVLGACGERAASPDRSLPARPTRTAAQDDAMRNLLGDVAEARVCEALIGRYAPLPDDRAAPGSASHPAVVGRLFISDCLVERRGEHLDIHIEGRGWQWVDHHADGPLGSRFSVRGNVRMQTALDLTMELDVRYDERARRVGLVLTPLAPPRARISATSELPVLSDGSWSGLIGGLGGLLGASPAEQARPVFEQEAARIARRQLGEGVTMTLDLCSMQPDFTLRALGDSAAPPARAFEEDGRPWISNERVRLHPTGLDLDGPHATEGAEMLVDVEVEEGGALSVSIGCRDPAERTAARYLASASVDDLPSAHALVSPGARHTLTLDAHVCEEAVVQAVPAPGATEPITYRMRVRRGGEPPEPILPCSE